MIQIRAELWLEEIKRKNELNISRQVNEQKIIMKKITCETDDVIDNICYMLKKQSVCFEDYITYLYKTNKALLQGMDIRKVIMYLQRNEYLNYEGEEIMTIEEFDYINGFCRPLHFEIAAKQKSPEIVDINIIVPNKVVEVTFADGTKEKSVCREPDVFSLESSISICISKKIMGGTGAYNKAVKRGVKVYDDKLKKVAAEKAEQERIAKRRAKRLAYKERRAAKREQAEKERQIEIQKEAYIRAMKHMQNPDIYNYKPLVCPV